MTVDPVREWAEGWLGRHDEAVARRVLDPAYTLHIGGGDLAGIDAYLGATRRGLLEPFPDVGAVVHEVVRSGSGVAVHLTLAGAAASWPVVALFRCEDGRIVEGWAEEDYLGRRRQQDTGEADAVPPAAVDWQAPDRRAAPGAIEAVTAWVAGISPLAGAETSLDRAVASGSRVAFHGAWRGAYVGGIEGIDAGGQGATAVLPFAGLATATGDGVADQTVIADVLGLRRALRHRGGPPPG